jgi:hypothetical protein
MRTFTRGSSSAAVTWGADAIRAAQPAGSYFST